MFRFFRFLILALALSPMAAMAAVNINTASAPTLQRVKGINAARADAIVKYREDNGRFASVNDLIKVPGINAKALNKIRPQVTVGHVRKAKHHHHHHRPSHSRG